LSQPPNSHSCEACVDGEPWVCVLPGQPLTGEESVIRLCRDHVEIVEGTPGWRKVWDKPLPGVPLDAHELMTVAASRLEELVPGSPIPRDLRTALAAVFRDAARQITLAGYVEQKFRRLLELAEHAWYLDHTVRELR
jgi:hypothetical protein